MSPTEPILRPLTADDSERLATASVRELHWSSLGCSAVGRCEMVRPLRLLNPETQYVKTPDGAHIAYQVFGSGPFDLVFAPGFA
ncbi:MAG TPA: hypothetical protein VH650_02025, partial [Gaiellaceae bacterium]